MNLTIKLVIFAGIMVAVMPAAAQVPGKPTPAKVAREVKTAEREASAVAETVQGVNDMVNALKDVRRTIDSVVANDKSHTAGEVHFIFLGINYTDENLAEMETELKGLAGITDVKKVQKTATVTLEMKSSRVPFDIWKDLPKKIQRSYIVHDKDANNVVLIYQARGKAKK